MTSVRFSVHFWKNCGFLFGFSFTKLTMVSVFWNVCCLMCTTLEMTYFRAELVQLIVNWSDSELEVQRYSMKKNMLTVDPIMLQDELWMRREIPSPNRRSLFFWKPNRGNRVFGFWILRSFRFGFKTRKPSCRWQTCAMLVKSLHGLRKSSGVVSCVASLPIDSVPMVSYYVLYSNCVCKMRRFGDTRHLKLLWPWNPGGQGSLKVIESDTIQ